MADKIVSSLEQEIYRYWINMPDSFQEKVFYSENEEAYLLIKNPCELNKLKVIVNNKELDIKLKKEEVKTPQSTTENYYELKTFPKAGF